MGAKEEGSGEAVRGGGGMKLENFVYFICNVYASRMSLTLGFFVFVFSFIGKRCLLFFCQICVDIEPFFLSIIGLVNYTATCYN